MERFNYAEVANYKILAKYYDELLIDDIAQYDPWLSVIAEKPFKTVLELASGSAILARELALKGYDITASDISEEMHEAAIVNGYRGKYEIINMISYNLNKTFDLILCILDSINYLEEEELPSFFESCYMHLNKGGRLIVDFHNIERLNEFKDEYIEEGVLTDKTAYQWTILSDPYDRTLNENFIFYQNDKTIIERHEQHVFNAETIFNCCQKANFKTTYINNFIPHEKDLLIGEK